MAEIDQEPFDCAAFPGLNFTLTGDRDMLMLNATDTGSGQAHELLSLHRFGHLTRYVVGPGLALLPGTDDGKIPLEENAERNALRPRARRENVTTRLPFPLYAHGANGVLEAAGMHQFYLRQEDNEIQLFVKSDDENYADLRLLALTAEGVITRPNISDHPRLSKYFQYGEGGQIRVHDSFGWRNRKSCNRIAALFDDADAADIAFLASQALTFLAQKHPEKFREYNYSPDVDPKMLTKWAESFVEQGWRENAADAKFAKTALEQVDRKGDLALDREKARVQKVYENLVIRERVVPNNQRGDGR
jgi:hypothetical protein